MKLLYRSAALVGLATLGLAPAVTGPVSASARTTASAPAARTSAAHPAIPGGQRLWVARYNGGTGGSAAADSVTLSPDGSTVYVTGTGGDSSGRGNLDTVAYNAATGATLWTSVYKGTNHPPTESAFITVSPDGSQVFVLGAEPHNGQVRYDDYLVVAYNAATGAQNWVQLFSAWYQASKGGIGISPDGSTLYITGLGPQVAYHTLALSAATGAQLWAADYSFHPNSNETASSLTVSPDGSEVFVTGQAGTVAYDAATGAQLWAAAYQLSWQRRFSVLAVSPDSSTLFVAGRDKDQDHGFLTIAYNAATGTQIWQKLLTTPTDTPASGIAVSPDGSAVYVTGTEQTSQDEATTVAYNAATGGQLWLAHYIGVKGTGTGGIDVAVSPDGSAVYVAGFAPVSATSLEAYLTVAYDASTGARLWTSRYVGVKGSENLARDIAVTSGGVFVTGLAELPPLGPGGTEFQTVAIQP